MGVIVCVICAGEIYNDHVKCPCGDPTPVWKHWNKVEGNAHPAEPPTSLISNNPEQEKR